MFLDDFSDARRSFNNLVAALQNNLPPNFTLLVLSTDSGTMLNWEVDLIALVGKSCLGMVLIRYSDAMPYTHDNVMLRIVWSIHCLYVFFFTWIQWRSLNIGVMWSRMLEQQTMESSNIHPTIEWPHNRLLIWVRIVSI